MGLTQILSASAGPPASLAAVKTKPSPQLPFQPRHQEFAASSAAGQPAAGPACTAAQGTDSSASAQSYSPSPFAAASLVAIPSRGSSGTLAGSSTAAFPPPGGSSEQLWPRPSQHSQPSPSPAKPPASQGTAGAPAFTAPAAAYQTPYVQALPSPAEEVEVEDEDASFFDQSPQAAALPPPSAAFPWQKQHQHQHPQQQQQQHPHQNGRAGSGQLPAQYPTYRGPAAAAAAVPPAAASAPFHPQPSASLQSAGSSR